MTLPLSWLSRLDFENSAGVSAAANALESQSASWSTDFTSYRLGKSQLVGLMQKAHESVPAPRWEQGWEPVAKLETRTDTFSSSHYSPMSNTKDLFYSELYRTIKELQWNDIGISKPGIHSWHRRFCKLNYYWSTCLSVAVKTKASGRNCSACQRFGQLKIQQQQTHHFVSRNRFQ